MVLPYFLFSILLIAKQHIVLTIHCLILTIVTIISLIGLLVIQAAQEKLYFVSISYVF